MLSFPRPLLVVPLLGATLLGGCATYSRPSAAYTYFSVPCDTPGAFRAVPIAPDGAPDAAAAVDAPPAAPPPTIGATPGSDGRVGSHECLIAVADRGRGPGVGYYPGGYGYPNAYPYGYYGSPFRGSIGIGIGIGGHRRGGHFGGGHRGGHGGGRH